MITLQDKLYESLLDDEEDLVSSESVEKNVILEWAKKFNIDVTKTLSKITPSIKIEKDNSVSSKILRPFYKGDCTLKDIFDQPFKFKKIEKLLLAKGTLNNCVDLNDYNQYKYIPNCVDELKLFFLHVSDYENIRFDKIFNILSNANSLHITISDNFATKFLKNINYVPNRKLADVEIYLRSGVLNLDSISDLNCDRFIIQNFSNKNLDTLIKPITSNINKPEFDYNNRSKANETINSFFNRNNVKQLILRDSQSTGYKIVKHPSIDWYYDFEKIKL